MTKASQLPSLDYVKLLITGETKTGKSGSLLSLLEADYRIYYIDMDNGCEALVNFAKHRCPDKLDNLDIETLRDVAKFDGAGIEVASPRSFVKACKLTSRWSDKTDIHSLGPDAVLVIDSLTYLGRAAYEWGLDLLGGRAKVRDNRRIYGPASKALIDILAAVTGPGCETNVVVISHNRYEMKDIFDHNGKKVGEEPVRGFPMAVGEAAGMQVPTLFNTWLLLEMNNRRREFKTQPTDLIAASVPLPSGVVKASYPVETGLADIFNLLLGKKV